MDPSSSIPLEGQIYNLSVQSVGSANDSFTSAASAGEEEIVSLNVGGQLFETSKATLLKGGETMLSKLLSGQFKARLDGSNRIFVDRDGTHFRYILNYLRSGKFVPPNDPASIQELLVEADYYQVKELSNHIERHLQREKKVQYCKVLCNGDWIGQLNYLVERNWEISKFMMETESKYRELDDYGKPLKNGIGWYDIQTQCILLKKPIGN
eukprot:TRINITY_DN631_c0_g1_i2.p1 TRINITY_DN631_c0_g1~~TRINITY_DN631_c0_g1_i2.p1  ORF type:complete len:210 (+),score=46.84 TRINITY_DN631_c0_g1_i2:63-692(+)